jgi:large subunit ribosomal protein L1
MAKHSKRYQKLLKEVEGVQPQTVPGAVKKLHGFGTTKFDQSVEIAIRLGIDPKQADQNVRGSVSLPNGIGKSVRVAVFAQGERAEVARANGADIVGAEDLAEKVKGGWMDFDVCLASPDMMKVVGPLGRVLGPKGLMPTPKTGTMTENIADAVREFKAGKVEYRADSGGNVHAIVGKLSQSEDKLSSNIEAFINHIRAVKPAAVKGQYIRSITVSATMSPGIPIIAT